MSKRNGTIIWEIDADVDTSYFPDHELMRQILKQAYLDIYDLKKKADKLKTKAKRNIGGSGAAAARDLQQTIDWFADDSTDPYTFVGICIELFPDSWARKIRDIREAITKPKIEVPRRHVRSGTAYGRRKFWT